MRRMVSVLGAGALVFSAAALPLAMLGAVPAAAAGHPVAGHPVALTSGSCLTSINGNAGSRFVTPEHAYSVDKNATVQVTGSMPNVPSGSLIHYEIQLQFYAPFTKFHWTVADDHTRSHDFQGSVKVEKYAKYSTGLYLVHVVASNDAGTIACQSDSFVKVTGGMSDAELAAGVLGGAGAVGGLAAGVLASREGSELGTAEDLASEEAAEPVEEAIDELTGPFGLCMFMMPAAVALTVVALVRNSFHRTVDRLTRRGI